MYMLMYVLSPSPARALQTRHRCICISVCVYLHTDGLLSVAICDCCRILLQVEDTSPSKRPAALVTTTYTMRSRSVKHLSIFFLSHVAQPPRLLAKLLYFIFRMPHSFELCFVLVSFQILPIVTSPTLATLTSGPTSPTA